MFDRLTDTPAFSWGCVALIVAAWPIGIEWLWRAIATGAAFTVCALYILDGHLDAVKGRLEAEMDQLMRDQRAPVRMYRFKVYLNSSTPAPAPEKETAL